MPRGKRKAKNQVLFREVNARIANLAASLGEPPEAQDFVCECALTGCTAMVRMPIEIYARAREDPALFIVLRGHEDPSNERIVEDHDSYLIVRTNPDLPADVAQAR